MRSMSRTCAIALLAACTAGFPGVVRAHGPSPEAASAVAATPASAPAAVLFRNVRVFDGVSGRVSAAQDVLVYKMASDISADQTTEINRMTLMLGALPPSGGR